MPLEINEIAIQMRVGEPDRRESAKKTSSDGHCGEEDRAAITEDVVRRVLDILKTTGDR